MDSFAKDITALCLANPLFYWSHFHNIHHSELKFCSVSPLTTGCFGCRLCCASPVPQSQWVISQQNVLAIWCTQTKKLIRVPIAPTVIMTNDTGGAITSKILSRAQMSLNARPTRIKSGKYHRYSNINSTAIIIYSP